MAIFDYKKLEDGTYEYKDCGYETLLDVVQTGILDFCGCGDPFSNVSYVVAGLMFIDVKYPHSLETSEAEGERFLAFDKEQTKKGLELFGGEAGRDFFYYWADKEEFTEHGFSLSTGGSLTDKGKEFLRIAKLALAEENGA